MSEVDLDRRMRTLDQVAATDVWSRVGHGEPRPRPLLGGWRRIATIVTALAISVAALAFAMVALRSEPLVDRPQPGSGPHGRPITVSAIDPKGIYRCTASFPSSTVAPGQPAGVKFTVTNLSARAIKIPEGAGNGATGYLVERTPSGRLLQDTSHRHDGIIGGFAFDRPVRPGDDFALPAYDAPLLWSGPIVTSPMCPAVGPAIALPDVILRVSAPGAAPSSADAVARAVLLESPTFDRCSPADSGAALVGVVPRRGGDMDARCEALVIQERGFDVVVLAIYSPPAAVPIDLQDLTYEIAASPWDLKLSGSEAVSWRVVAVSSSNVVEANFGAVASNCDGSSYETGGRLLRCSRPTTSP